MDHYCIDVALQAASQYGDSYITLRPEVRLRVTMTNQDSLGGSPIMGTCDHYGHVLADFNDAELRDIVRVASGEVEALSSAATQGGRYKEIQIHGPVELSRDVDALRLHDKHKGNAAVAALAQEFCEKNGCDLLNAD